MRLPAGWEYVNIFADCETYIDTEHTYLNLEDYKNRDLRDLVFRNEGVVVPWLLCFEVPRVGIDPQGRPRMLVGREILWTVYPHEDFFKKLRHIYECKKVPLIWFHNTTYDITALFPTAMKYLDPNMEIFFHVKDSNNDFITGQIYSPKYKFKAVLGDTMKYKKISLGKVGEMFNFPKGSVVYTMANLEIIEGVGYYTNWETGRRETFLAQDYINYCIRDVQLLSRYYDYITKFKLQLFNAVFKEDRNPKKIARYSTVGEQAKDMFNCYIYRHLRGNFDEYFRPTVNKLEYYRQYKSNNGGFTSMNNLYPFYRCGEGEKIFYIDINGSYSYVMSRGIPYGKLMSTKPDKGNYVAWIRVQINSFEWVGYLKDLTKTGIGETRFKNTDLPTHTDENDWYTEKEIYIPENVFKWLKENANIKYKFRGKFYQFITMIARDYMEFVNEVRNEYKDRAQNHPDEVERLLANEIQKNIKISANSIYGKFCQKCYFDERFYVGDMFADYPKNEEEIKYQGTLTGAFVTWMGRYKLFKKILELCKAGFKFLYCDTDSIIGVFEEAKREKLLSIVGINSQQLGEWKIEGFFNEFAYLKSKKYMLINYDNPEKSKIVFSGIFELDRWLLAFKEGLLNNFENTLKLLRDIFDHNQNWVFLRSKRNAIRTLKYNQTIIRVSDFNTNSSYRAKKIRNGEIWLVGEAYEYERK